MPTCEVVVRAKRLNVLPNAVELVWFDGPDLAHIGSDEYGNEAFSAYLALLGAHQDTSLLCGSTTNLLTANGQAAVPYSPRFAHGIRSACIGVTCGG